jgi:hypothetical protein
MSGEAAAVGNGLLADPLLAGVAGALLLVVIVVAIAIVLRPSLLDYLRGGKGKANLAAAVADEDEDAGKPKITILFGTQTGTAERFSKQLKSELQSRYGKGNAISVVGKRPHCASFHFLSSYLMEDWVRGQRGGLATASWGGMVLKFPKHLQIWRSTAVQTNSRMRSLCSSWSPLMGTVSQQIMQQTSMDGC